MHRAVASGRSWGEAASYRRSAEREAMPHAASTPARPWEFDSAPLLPLAPPVELAVEDAPVVEPEGDDEPVLLAAEDEGVTDAAGAAVRGRGEVRRLAARARGGT